MPAKGARTRQVQDVSESVLLGALPGQPGDSAGGVEEELHEDDGQGRDEQGHHGADRRRLGRLLEESARPQPDQEESRDGENPGDIDFCWFLWWWITLLLVIGLSKELPGGNGGLLLHHPHTVTHLPNVNISQHR